MLWLTFSIGTMRKKLEKIIVDAKKQLPANQLPLTLALFEEAMGRMQHAGEHHQAAPEGDPKRHHPITAGPRSICQRPACGCRPDPPQADRFGTCEHGPDPGRLGGRAWP